ncbi:MAG: pyrroline-5-carboxylate reductase [Clostridia bacterium]|nr:pyrroline-5-carboxylate reductase [Clostridia bacterium]
MRRIAFIGVGNMAGAIIGGMLKSGAVDYGHLILSDRFPEKCASYVEKGAVIAASPAEAAAQADCIVLSVKPQNFCEILPELGAVEEIDKKLIITIAAGISVETVKTALHGAPVVRVLPNTPMLIGMGVSVICRADDVSLEDFAFVRSIFEASGSVTIIDETDMNRIISVTSSSPAYVFAFINAIYEGAKEQGLDGDALLGSICDVVMGSAALLKSGSLTPAEQIKVVTSKGGTTERAMNVLYERDITAMVAEAMKACTARAEEMDRTMKV